MAEYSVSVGMMTEFCDRAELKSTLANMLRDYQSRNRECPACKYTGYTHGKTCMCCGFVAEPIPVVLVEKWTDTMRVKMSMREVRILCGTSKILALADM